MTPLSILYTDADLVVAVKPAGMLSQGDEKGSESILTALETDLGGEIFPLHRLDRETGGVMVFARSPQSAAFLSRALQEKRFHKEYLAVLTAPPPETEGRLEDLLYFDRRQQKVFPVKRQRKGVKKAVLQYRLDRETGGLFLVRVFPETGRTHQIRVQFAARKAPLYGDRRYGGQGAGLGLFCRALTFPHPAKGEDLTFSALPEGGPPWSLFFEL